MSRLRRHRAALLGAVFGLGLLAGAAVTTNTWVAPSAAVAQPQTVDGAVTQPFSFADVVETVRPAVVSVRVQSVDERRTTRFEDGFPRDFPFERFFGRPGPRDDDGRRGQPRQRTGQGSGFFISDDGFIVTNHHVVRDAEEVTIITDDGSNFDARVIGTDERTDLALLKVDAGETFAYVEFSDGVPRVGDWVVAVGNPFGLGGTVTAGIVSARGRDIGNGPYNDFIQIDAAVNRGNSGGPTFDLSGRVVGVNTAIFSPTGGNVGIAFAVPSETAQSVIGALREDGVVTRGWLGVRIQPVSDEIAESIGLDMAMGAIVTEPQAGSPAEDAGLRAGDTILEVDGVPIDGPRELARAIAAYEPGSDVEVTYWRNGTERDVMVRLGTLPEAQQLASLAPSDGPIDEAPAMLDDLGISLAPAASVGAAPTGVVVTEIDQSGAAAERGVRRGDVILEAGGTMVETPGDLAEAMREAQVEGRRSVLVRIERDGQSQFVALPIGRI